MRRFLNLQFSPIGVRAGTDHGKCLAAKQIHIPGGIATDGRSSTRTASFFSRRRGHGSEYRPLFPQLPAGQPVSLNVEGSAVTLGKEICRQATPADGLMQAFEYRHLVPAAT